VSSTNSDRNNGGMVTIGARAKGAYAQAVPLGKRAGTTAVQGARQGVAGATQWATPMVQDAVMGARYWAAPWIEGAADAVDNAVAPRVSSALRSTARQVRPVPPARTGTRRMLDWRWLLGLGAALAAAGASAAVAMRRRYANATAQAEDTTEPDAAGGSPDGESPADPPHLEVNGRVTTPDK
jgi:hypothetical protein